MNLVERKLLAKYRSGRFWQFIAAKNLEEKLKKSGLTGADEDTPIERRG